MISVGGYAIFAVDDPAPILEAVPFAKSAVYKGSPVVAVPDHIDCLHILANLGVAVDSPVKRSYHWPMRPTYTKRWWQGETTEFLTLNRRCFVHNAMRTGKTLSTCWAFDFLQQQRAVKKVLIVAPLSSLELAWAETLYSCFPRKKYAVLHGSPQKRKELLAKDVDVYIINHDGVEVLNKELCDRPDINCVVIDECHEYHNVSTRKWAFLDRLVNKSGFVEWCWGLSGTPTPQSPLNAYGQSRMVVPWTYKGSQYQFKRETMLQIGPFKWVPRLESEKIVKQVLSPSIRFGRDVVTDMEPCIIERHADLSREQMSHYKKLKKDLVTEIAGKEVTAVNAAVLVQRIVQTACGVVYGKNKEFLEIDFGPRLEVLRELIAQNEEKVLVFVPFTGALGAIARELGKEWSVATVDGSVSPGARNKIFRDFQKEADPHVIVAHPGTMAYSLELTAASLVIWYAPPAGGNKVYQQACARIDGGGQTAKIDIAHISGTPEERRAYSVVQGKGKWQDVLLDL